MKAVKPASFHIDVVGLMSGTSLDGLDLCCVSFDFDGRWHYRIVKAESIDYPEDLRRKLATAQRMSSLDYARLHSDYGLYLGEQVRSFVERNQLKADLVASHGQTIFHQPGVRFMAQIGSGAGIAAVSGIDTVCDFRTTFGRRTRRVWGVGLGRVFGTAVPRTGRVGSESLAFR